MEVVPDEDLGPEISSAQRVSECGTEPALKDLRLQKLSARARSLVADSVDFNCWRWLSFP